MLQVGQRIREDTPRHLRPMLCADCRGTTGALGCTQTDSCSGVHEHEGYTRCEGLRCYSAPVVCAHFRSGRTYEYNERYCLRHAESHGYIEARYYVARVPDRPEG